MSDVNPDARAAVVAEAAQVSAIDADHLANQRDWSERTFGPGSRLLGVLDHIRKELKEIEDNPTDVTEWVDVIILAFDGAWRAGWEPQQIIDAIKAKQAKNEARTWPDWRTAAPDKAIEHIDYAPEFECQDCGTRATDDGADALLGWAHDEGGELAFCPDCVSSRPGQATS